ncbi:MAG TPA: hypothetical protein VK909_00635 [Anaerolineales bacterium]|nr:hypothetical protein [Anaerolineales bacterium]
MSIKKWLPQMSDEKKDKEPLPPAPSTESERDVQGPPETTFLPPLKMFLAFFDKESRQKKKKQTQEDSDEKKVEKLIEKLSESEEGKSNK